MDKSISLLTSHLENISLLNSSSLQMNVSVGNKSLKQQNGCKSTPIKSFLQNKVTPTRCTTKTPNRLFKKDNNKNVNNNQPNTPKTPANGDRFIPDRSAMNFEIGHYLMNNDTNNSSDSNKSTTMSELVGNLSNYRILSYQTKAPAPPEGHLNDAKVVYSCTKSTSRNKSSRYIAKQPERILDAPDVRDDYYLQLLDWNDKNVLAVALNNEVYLWNAIDGSIVDLLTLDVPDYISSLSWVQNGGQHLAVGLSTGVTQIWDVAKNKRLRCLNNSLARISCMSWNSYILSNGNKEGEIYNHDVRISSSLVGTLQGHTLEICGLKWSNDGRFLASGGNDNTINIWANNYMGQTTTTSTNNPEPIYRLTHHQAAVKALAWCPWRSNCLASGGGTNDRMIRIWNTQNGHCMYSVDTRSQVSAILWSEEYRELISSHGYANNELIIWKYPNFTKVAELIGHTGRILGMAMSADGSTVVSLGADETLRFWDCFETDVRSKNKKAAEKNKDKETVTMKFSIR